MTPQQTIKARNDAREAKQDDDDTITLKLTDKEGMSLYYLLIECIGKMSGPSWMEPSDVENNGRIISILGKINKLRID